MAHHLHQGKINILLFFKTEQRIIVQHCVTDVLKNVNMQDPSNNHFFKLLRLTQNQLYTIKPMWECMIYKIGWNQEKIT